MRHQKRGKLTKLLQSLLVRKYSLDSKIILHKCFLVHPLPRLFKYFRSIEKQGRHVYIQIYREKLRKSSCLKLKGLEFRYLVCSIFLWSSTNLFKLFPWGQNWPYPGDHPFHIYSYIGKNLSPV